MENKRIIKLSKQTTNKIAAGEVVERPVSIVKELVENSIDSGATSIAVEIKNGGKTYIRITDNGSGIVPEEVEIAFERHATSKISDSEDLNHIRSLGFRGEALASIAAVSHTELITKTSNNQSGIQVKLDGGLVTSKKEIGCPNGTTIIISDLFYNTPARLKFLKQDATEANLIIDLVAKMSLAFSTISFRLINNGKILFSTSGSGDIYKSITSIYQKDIARDLIHVSEKNDIYELEAYISTTSNTRSNKKYQIFFMNGRYIKSAILDKALNKAYRELIFEGRYPIAFMFLKVKSEWVDVNIHPNKREVRFRDEQGIEAFIDHALINNLRSAVASIPKINIEKIFIDKKLNDEIKTPDEKQVDIISLSETKPKSFDDVWEKPKNYQSNAEQNVIELKEPKIDKAPIQPKEEPFDMLSLNIMGTVFAAYIAVFDKDFFYLIDQHAAHERILYEELMDKYLNENILIQKLLTPYILDLSASDTQNVQENIAFIKKLGYEIELFGNNSFIIKGVPSILEFNDSKSFIEEVIDHLSSEKITEQKEQIEKIITKACKKAVKAHDHLDIKEIKHMISLLSKTNNPFSCPHGRPVFIKLSEQDIEKMFKRS